MKNDGNWTNFQTAEIERGYKMIHVSASISMRVCVCMCILMLLSEQLLSKHRAISHDTILVCAQLRSVCD